MEVEMCCGAKHILKSKVSKTAAFEPILMELLKLVQLVKSVDLVKLVSYELYLVSKIVS